MSTKIDIQKSARLAVEACMLTRLIYINYINGFLIDNLDGRAFLMCYKAWRRFRRRLNLLDAVIDAPEGATTKIYVGECDKDTLPRDTHYLTTVAGHTVYFDIAEFGNR